MDLIPPSVVESYDVSHLHALAAHMVTSAADREELMGSLNGLAGGQIWVGLGREAQDAALAEHTTQASTASAALSATAVEATAGAETLYLQKMGLVAGLQDGQTMGLEIDDEYNVTDPLAATPAGKMRASMVQELQGQLKAGAQAFTETEQTTAQAIHTSMGTVGGGTAAHMAANANQTTPGASSGSGASMLDSHFKTGGGDPTEPLMPSIGNEPHEDMLISTQDGAASTQSGLGVEDTRLPPMPSQWPPKEPEAPVPPAPCGPLEAARDTFDVAAADAAETAGVALFPLEGPAMVPSALALLKGAEIIGTTSDTEIQCLERGIG